MEHYGQQEAGNEEEIFSLYDVLPGYGETSVSLIWANGDAKLSIQYDDDTEVNKLNTMVLIFENCVACDLASFPGISMYKSQRENYMTLGSLIEFKTSGYADLWNKHFGYLDNEIKHLSVLFLHENKQFHAFAKKVNCIIE